jgi:hypothetical protein
VTCRVRGQLRCLTCFMEVFAMPDNLIRIYVADSISQQKTTKPLKLPRDVASGKVAAKVAMIFGHGLTDDKGHSFDYRFRDENGNLLDPDHTLEKAKVRSESTLHLTYQPTAAEQIG